MIFEENLPLRLHDDIICLLAQALATDGCDYAFTMLAKLVTSSSCLKSRIAKTIRPVVLLFTKTVEKQGAVRLPICPKSITGSILVDWGDNSQSYYQQRKSAIRCQRFEHPTHHYSAIGSYCVRIFRTSTKSRLESLRNCACFYDSLLWTLNLCKFCSIGDIGIISIARLFAYEYYFNLPRCHVDVSHCTNMEGLFYKCYQFNQPLSKWNVSNVVNMNDMFSFAHSFRQPIDSWDISAVRRL